MATSNQAMFALKAGLHSFPKGAFGSVSDLICPTDARDHDTLMIACSEQGAAPDNVSFAKPGRMMILQHIGASIPSQTECELHEGLSFDEVEKMFDRYQFRHVIICGHLGCGVIRRWLQPSIEGHTDIGSFRLRFEKTTRHLVDNNYAPDTATERVTLMICEHVLCQVENLITHPCVMERVQARNTSFHGWVVDDQTARVFGYDAEESAFVPL